MCPACVAAAALWLAGAGSTGGVAAWVAKRRLRNPSAKVPETTTTKGERDETAENRNPK